MSEKSLTKKNQKTWFVIMKRELASFFTSPIAYIVTGLFLLITGFWYFSTFFLTRVASLRNFFELLPIMFCLFVPALTMRVFSEENRIGSMETLVTLPVSSVEIVMGKYLASFISTLVLLVPTVFYVIIVSILGNPDFGPIIGAYIGAFFLLASYSAIGVFASSVTKNQILSFFVAFIICAVLTFLDWFKILLPAFLVKFLDFISASSHFESISRGIIDSRDIVYFLTLSALFIVLTVRSLQNSRRG